MFHSIHSSPLTPIKTIEVGYECYWTGHSSYGLISSSWSLTECVFPVCDEVMPHWMIFPVVLEFNALMALSDTTTDAGR